MYCIEVSQMLEDEHMKYWPKPKIEAAIASFVIDNGFCKHVTNNPYPRTREFENKYDSFYSFLGDVLNDVKSDTLTIFITRTTRSCVIVIKEKENE